MLSLRLRSRISALVSLGALILAVALSPAGSPANASSGTTYLVGTAKVSIEPTFPNPDGAIYLGGVFPGPLRKADGNWMPTYARAIAISTDEPGSGVILGEIETQGQFAAYRQGPYGLDDIQRDVAAQTGLNPWQIVLGADHTHAGADAIGVWGGVPESYLRLLKDRFEEAVLAAWENRTPATLAWASTTAPDDMLKNQSRYQMEMDYELRVLVARDPATRDPIAFLPNWQGHPSIVPGTKIHPDWPGALNQILESRHPGAFSMTVPGDIGRTQTGQSGNTDEGVGDQKAIAYSARLADLLDAAISTNLHEIAPGPVTSAQVFFTETTTNPLILGLFHGGVNGVSDIYRSKEAPWLQGPAAIGARAFTVRIGDVVLGAAPGEAYPAVRDGLRDFAGASATFFMALAGDQLGYLISPEEDVPLIAADGNDNVAFMVSPTIGDHVMCALIKGAEANGFTSGTVPNTCAPWTGDEANGGL